MKPVPETDVRVLLFEFEPVVVSFPRDFERLELGEAKIKYCLHASCAQVGRHLAFATVFHVRAPSMILQLKLLLRAQRIAALRAPVRMNIDQTRHWQFSFLTERSVCRGGSRLSMCAACKRLPHYEWGT